MLNCSLRSVPADWPVDPFVAQDGLFRGSLSGELPTLLLDTTIDPENLATRTSVEDYVQNNLGQVLCVIQFFDQTGQDYRRLAKFQSSTVTTVTDTKTGLFLNPPGGISHLAMNDHGQVVFMAQFKDPSGKTQVGLFNGPDPVKDRIIASGDALFGSKVLTVPAFQRCEQLEAR